MTNYQNSKEYMDAQLATSMLLGPPKSDQNPVAREMVFNGFYRLAKMGQYVECHSVDCYAKFIAWSKCPLCKTYLRGPLFPLLTLD